MKKYFLNIMLAFFLVFVFSGSVFGWSCETHKFIASEAIKGILTTTRIDIRDDPESACCPDTCRGENYDAVAPFHFYNAAPNTEVNPEYLDQNVEWVVLKLFPYLSNQDQIEIKVPNKSGALYWEILELYKDMKEEAENKKTVYYSDIAHFVGDLSQPLHNFPHGNALATNGERYPKLGNWAIENTGKDRDGNKKDRHWDFDNTFDAYSANSLQTTEGMKAFEECIPLITIESLNDLKLAVSRIANSSIGLANTCYEDNRNISPEEASEQVKLSIALLRAIMANLVALQKETK